MTKQEIISAYAKWTDAIITAGDGEIWEVSTPEIGGRFTTDELVEMAAPCLERVAELIDAEAFTEAVQSEYTWIYDAEVDGRRFEYTPALDRFEDLEPWEQTLLKKYVETAKDLIVSDREVLAFITTIDKAEF